MIHKDFQKVIPKVIITKTYYLLCFKNFYLLFKIFNNDSYNLKSR